MQQLSYFELDVVHIKKREHFWVRTVYFCHVSSHHLHGKSFFLVFKKLKLKLD